jgi:hypothetical protein
MAETSTPHSAPNDPQDKGHSSAAQKPPSKA